ncbi:MAG: DsbA family protein [Microvirga sp.]
MSRIGHRDASTLWYFGITATIRFARTTTSSSTTQHLKIDVGSDVACPWCVIGLRRLEQALANAADADITFQPFELNPRMPAAGQSLGEYITEKYSSTAEQSAASRAMNPARPNPTTH